MLTQGELAEKLGITKQTQGLYERGQRTPSADYLATLAGLGGDSTYVLTGCQAQSESALSKEDEELLANYHRLREEQRSFVRETVAALAAANSKSAN